MEETRTCVHTLTVFRRFLHFQGQAERRPREARHEDGCVQPVVKVARSVRPLQMKPLHNAKEIKPEPFRPTECRGAAICGASWENVEELNSLGRCHIIFALARPSESPTPQNLHARAKKKNATPTPTISVSAAWRPAAERTPRGMNLRIASVGS